MWIFESSRGVDRIMKGIVMFKMKFEDLNAVVQILDFFDGRYVV